MMNDGVRVRGGAASPRPKPSLQQWLGSGPPPPGESPGEPARVDAVAGEGALPRSAEARDTPPAGQRRAAAGAGVDAGAAGGGGTGEAPTPPRRPAAPGAAGPNAPPPPPPPPGLRPPPPP